MVREIAERILFGTTLEEKLTPPPPEVGDEQRGEAIAVPRSPSRPKGLELRSDGVRAEFPGTVGIEDESREASYCISLPIMNCWQPSLWPLSC